MDIVKDRDSHCCVRFWKSKTKKRGGSRFSFLDWVKIIYSAVRSGHTASCALAARLDKGLFIILMMQEQERAARRRSMSRVSYSVY